MERVASANFYVKCCNLALLVCFCVGGLAHTWVHKRYGQQCQAGGQFVHGVVLMLLGLEGLKPVGQG